MKAAWVANPGNSTFDAVYYTVRSQILKEFDCCPRQITYDNFRENRDFLRETEVIFSKWGMPSFTEEDIAECFPKLRAVFYAAGTVQSFARPFLNRGIKVFSAWQANAVPVAEYAVSQIILASKGYFQSTRIFREEGREAASKYCARFCGNYGAKIGLLGAGMIGTLVIKMLKAYKLDILVFDPFMSEERAKELGVRKATLEEIFRECPVISNHLANNEKTQKMLGYPLFSLMQENATFINTGRGAQIIEEDLVRILQEKPLATAVLDVTFPEPPLEGHAFYTLPNVLLTPHIAGSAGDEVARMGQYMYDECRAYLAGEPLQYEVTLKMLETMA